MLINPSSRFPHYTYPRRTRARRGCVPDTRMCFDSWKISKRDSRSCRGRGGQACRGPLDGVKIAISLFRYAALSQRGAANARPYRSCKSNGRASLVIRRVFSQRSIFEFFFFPFFLSSFFCQRCSNFIRYEFNQMICSF